MKYSHQKLLSASDSKDPNSVVQADGRVYRKVAPVRAAHQGRWDHTHDFMRSKEIRHLQDMGLLIKTAQVPCLIDGADHYQTQKLPWLSWESQWTNRQFAESVILCALINQELAGLKSKFRASDCHFYNTSLLHSEMVYIDFGSFSHEHHSGVMSHLRMSLRHRGWDEKIAGDDKTLQQVIDHMRSRTPPEAKTEWDKYDMRPGPEKVGEIQAKTDEEGMIYDFVSGCMAESVLDIGGNSGTIARLIAAFCRIPVLTIDTSGIAINHSYDEARRLGLPITALNTDLYRLDARQSADMVVASSVTHHLIKAGHRFEDQSKKMAAHAHRFAAVEFIDPSDPHVQKWGAIKGYSRQEFERAFENDWEIIETQKPERAERTWFLMTKK